MLTVTTMLWTCLALTASLLLTPPVFGLNEEGRLRPRQHLNNEDGFEGGQQQLRDSSSTPVQMFVRDFGSNLTLSCADVRMTSSMVHLVNWFCRGCGGQTYGDDTEVQQRPVKVATFDSRGFAVFRAPERIQLLKETFALHLDLIRTSDSGDYYCTIDDNKYPTQISRLIVQASNTEGAPPDSPGKPLIMAFTSRSVNLSWTPPINANSAPVSHYVINIRVGENGEWGDMLETPDNLTTFQVKDLEPFTTYSFRIAAVNSAGKSEFSKESYYMLTLREVPSGKPTITAAHNTSSTAIQISWRSPQPETLHGEFLGYRIAYKPRNASGFDAVQEIRIKDPAVTRYTIQNLDIFTQYLVSLQVYNPEGVGPSTTVVVMTDEGIPSMPVNVSMREVTNTTVRVLWHRPVEPNGIIQGYRMYFMHQNFTDVRTVRDPMDRMEYFLDGLSPYTTYKIWLKAFTWKNEGHSSNPLEITTDVSGPSAPMISNLTCKDEKSIFLQWERPRKVFKAVDFYYVYFRNEEEWQFKEVAVGVNNGTTKGFARGSSILLENLKTDSLHEVKVRGATRSIYDASKVYKGDFSDPQSILLKLNCDQVHAYTMVGTSSSSSAEVALDLSAGMIAGVACVAFSIVLALLALGLWRKYFNESYYYLDETPATPAPSIVPEWDSDPASMSTSVPAQLYIQRIASLHSDQDIGFSKEFEAVQELTRPENFKASEAMNNENKKKNRYPNVIAYDHSRVQLRPLPGQKRGEYVNANYIDGFQRSRAYIATQGPMPSTFDSFWRMIWEQRIRVIAMLTNLVEMGKTFELQQNGGGSSTQRSQKGTKSVGSRNTSETKCDKYWPSQGTTQCYGLIEVTLVREDILATFTIRTFKIRHTRIKAAAGKLSGPSSAAMMTERYVLQFQFTVWPDYGVPENPLPLLSFVRRASDANRDVEAPILVHCSAGVGRTGAFILIDAMLKQMKTKGELNLVAYLKHIRTQRNYLVQTEEQYIFVHDALAEAVAAGETNIHRSYLTRYINSLQSSFTTDENSIPWQLLDRQFKLATAYQPQESQFIAALAPCNQSKNQNFDFLPIESARVAISPKPGVEGSDYINASWLPGLNNLSEFIVTQHPMEQTVLDFWQMLWDHQIKTVVILSPIDQQNFGIFWPDQSVDLELGPVSVSLSSESDYNNYQLKYFVLKCKHDDNELRVKFVFCPSWPHICGPQLPAASDLPSTVQSLHNDGCKSPIVVIDRFGGTEAAIFCALMTLIKQLEFEAHVDIYEYAKVSHQRRPGIWRSQNDYFYLYQVMDSLCNHQTVAQSSYHQESSFQTFHPQQNQLSSLPVQPNNSCSNGTATIIRVPQVSRSSSSNTVDVYQRY